MDKGGTDEMKVQPTGDDQHPFNDKFYKKILRLLNSTRTASVDDLQKMYAETLTYYEERSWTEYWGTGDKAAKDPSELSRNKKMDKPQAPIKKEQGQQKTSRSASPPPNAQQPSPSSSPKVAIKTEVKEAIAESKVDKNKRPTTLAVAEVNIFGDDEDEMVPRKKTKRLASESASIKEELQDDSSRSSSSDSKPAVFERAAVASSAAPVVPLQTSFASDMMCSVCRDLSVDIGNTLVTCDECSRLYHQNCHNPEIMSSELRDPRFIFVCMQCKQKRTKTAAFKSPGGSAAHPPAFSAKETASAAGKSSKSEKAVGKAQGPSLFKAVVPPPKDRAVAAAASPTSSPAKGTGIASLAADFLAKRAGKVVLPKLTVEAPPKLAAAVPPTAVPNVGVGKLAVQSPLPSTSTAAPRLVVPPKPIAPSPKNSSSTIPPMLGAEKRLQAMKKKAAQGKSMFK